MKREDWRMKEEDHSKWRVKEKQLWRGRERAWQKLCGQDRQIQHSWSFDKSLIAESLLISSIDCSIFFDSIKCCNQTFNLYLYSLSTISVYFYFDQNIWFVFFLGLFSPWKGPGFCTAKWMTLGLDDQEGKIKTKKKKKKRPGISRTFRNLTSGRPIVHLNWGTFLSC